MASQITIILFFSLTIHLTFSTTVKGENPGWFSETKLLDKKVEQTTNLHFFFHETTSGKNPSAITIAGPEKSFGLMRMADDPLTEGPEPTSKLIGRAQGVYGLASQSDISLLMVFNYVFLDGQFNGSSLTVLGRNPIMNNIREMPIVGGTGAFRFARGYVHAHTHSANGSGGTIVEYNVTVIH